METTNPEDKKQKSGTVILIAIGAVLVAMCIVAVILVYNLRKASKQLSYLEGMNLEYEDPGDINIDSLNEAAENIKNLKLDTDTDVNIEDTEVPDVPDDIDPSTVIANDDVVHYSYTDVTARGNDLTVVPNGGMNGSVVLMGGKDLNGFLDYVDSTVLEKGRTIKREFFYDMLAVMLVDKDLSSDPAEIEKNMIMALAMANNYHDTDVKIRQCRLDANNAAEYRYDVTAFGKDDTWIVNYGNRTVFINDGKTEYSSDMFKDEYLAVWVVAIEEYYGIKTQ